MGDIKISLGETSEVQGNYDLAIIGGGPAGLTAAMYAARGRVNHILLEKNAIPGGQIVNTESVENYPGFEQPIGGFELMEVFRAQAGKFAANIVNAPVSSLKKDGEHFVITTDNGKTIARAVIVASGASPRKMGIEGEDKFIGRGVSFCATCDGALYKGKTVAVIGGGDAGIEEGIFLTRFADKVIVIEVMDHLGATKILQERARKNPKMEIMLSHTPMEITGDNAVSGIIVENRSDGTREKIDVNGIFVYIGIKPDVDFISIEELKRDRNGFIISDDSMRTDVSGLFVAGDVRAKLLRQVSTAVGDGATAEFAAEKFLNERN